MGKTTYDAVVIGAGPAGCMAALTLARRGVRTLVVEKAAKGRWKVCGCCLGSVGQRAMRQAGLESVLARASTLDTFTLAARGRRASVRLDGFVSISRETLDAALAEAAEHAGADILWNMSATATPHGSVIFNDGNELRVGVVIDATGLRGMGNDSAKVSAGTRIGLGTTTTDDTCAPGELTMAVDSCGYLGRVALPDGRVDYAAAVKPAFIRAHASPAEAMRTIWRRAGLNPNRIPAGPWRGTPALTRTCLAQHGRILRVGDAAGYVEPFTGEGMSWAMHAASHIADDAISCLTQGPDASYWPRTLHALVAWRHARCRAVSIAVRSPRLIAAGLLVARALPAAGRFGASRLSGTHVFTRSPA